MSGGGPAGDAAGSRRDDVSGARVLALDHGAARCGAAISDPSGTIATPLDAVARPDTLKGLARVVALAAETDAGRVIVGLPLGLSGRETEQTRAARAFAERLRDRLAVPVELYDERFTTRIAARSRGAAASEDSRAAAVLLEDWLARHA